MAPPTKGGKPRKVASTKKWMKPEGKPKRPLSAYNLFFQHERGELMKAIEAQRRTPLGSDGLGIGFGNLARYIAERWKNIDSVSRSKYDAEAREEKLKYQQAVDKWRQEKTKKKQEQHTFITGLLIRNSFKTTMEKTELTESTSGDIGQHFDEDELLRTENFFDLGDGSSSNATREEVGYSGTTSLLSPQQMPSSSLRDFCFPDSCWSSPNCYSSGHSAYDEEFRRLMHSLKTLQSSQDEEFVQFVTTTFGSKRGEHRM